MDHSMDINQQGQYPPQEVPFQGPSQGPFQQPNIPAQGQYYEQTQGPHIPQPFQGPPTEPPQWVAQFIELMSQFGGNHHAPTAQTLTPNGSSTASTVRLEVDQKKPRHSLSPPEQFTNKDNSQYPQFRSLLEAKLRIDAKAIGSEEERVWYGFGCLSGDAARRIHPWMQYAQGTPEFSVKGLLDQMDQAFADPQKQAKALEKINRIRQGNQDFRTFLQDFEQTLLEAQGWGWADEVKKGYLKAGLNRELCDRLVTQVEPDKYSDFTAQLRMISDKLQQIKAWDNRRNRGRGGNSYVPQVTTQSTGDSMDWESTQPTAVAATGRTLSGRSQQGQGRAKWVSYEEIGRRRTNGSCIRCGDDSHMIRDCPFLPAQNPNRQQPAQRQLNKGGRQSNSNLSERKPRTASAHPTSTNAKSSRTNSTVKEVVVEEVEEWGTDEESGKE
jgi:hypothetical protein